MLTLSVGLLLGWIFFGGDPEPEHSHTEIINGEMVWTCSMHPQIRQNDPGTCPICGMNLIPLEDDDASIDPMAVTMSETAMQLANVVTDVVGSNSATKSIRLNGKVQEDERLVFSQTSHFPGRIEKLSVNFTGEFVRKGSALAELYSPQLVTAQEELLEANKIKESQPNLFRAAREKLRNWKLSESQIDQILISGEVKDQFPVLADHTGFVITKKINLGDHVNSGQSLYEIADLSRVWIVFDVYENDLPWIDIGDPIEFQINSLPGEIFQGKIDFIDPVINPSTRVTNARLVIQNPNGTLKPEMFATGEVKAELGRPDNQLTIPKSAVLWTGERSIVYVKLQSTQGTLFKMREVTLGPSLGETYVVVKGLEQGDIIAVNGAFSIDAAAQLAGKPSMMSPEGGAVTTGHNHNGIHPASSSSDHSQHQMGGPIEVNETVITYESDPAFKKQLGAVFSAYLPVKDALIQSDVKLATLEAKKLYNAIEKVDMTMVKGEAHMEWMKDLGVLREATNGILNEPDMEKVRTMLSPLSDQLFHTLKKFQIKVEGYRQYCPMAFESKGAFWLSDSDEILNPYFGDAMLTCGSVEAVLD